MRVIQHQGCRKYIVRKPIDLGMEVYKGKAALEEVRSMETVLRH